jgi:uncharacterized protein HemX
MAASDGGNTEGSVRRTITVTVRSLLLALLIVALGVAGFMLWRSSERQNNLAERQTAMEETLEELEMDISSLGQGSEVDETQRQQLRNLRADLLLIKECLPEIQGEIDTLEVSFGFASPSNTPSTKCSNMFYGGAPGLGD